MAATLTDRPECERGHMKSARRRPVFRLLLLVFSIGIAFGSALPADAGPYLRHSFEETGAKSPRGCRAIAEKVLRNLQGELKLSVSERNSTLASTPQSTVSIHCVAVGPDHFVALVMIASTDKQESEHILRRFQQKIQSISPID
jgi:hypothetical protein